MAVSPVIGGWVVGAVATTAGRVEFVFVESFFVVVVTTSGIHAQTQVLGTRYALEWVALSFHFSANETILELMPQPGMTCPLDLVTQQHQLEFRNEKGVADPANQFAG